jgi:hypothetical protein
MKAKVVRESKHITKNLAQILEMTMPEQSWSSAVAPEH